MLNFPKEEVFNLARKCHISASDARWISGMGEKDKPNESSNGACVRLGLLVHETRKDTKKKKLSDERIKCFLDAAIKEKWYLAWRKWIIYGNKSRNSKVDETKLPLPSTAVSSMNSGNKTHCYQPDSSDAERVHEMIDPDNIGVSETKLRDEIEREAKEQGKTLCPDWWENLKTESRK